MDFPEAVIRSGGFGSIGNIDKSIATVRFRDGRRRLTLLVWA